MDAESSIKKKDDDADADPFPERHPHYNDHSPDLLAAHDKFVTEALRTLRRQSILSRTTGLLTHRCRAVSPHETVEVMEGNQVKEVRALAFNLPRSQPLKAAIDMGITQAVFIPGQQHVDLSKGIPRTLPDGWVCLGTKFLDSPSEGTFLLAVTDPKRNVDGVVGTLLIEPMNGFDVLINFFEHLKKFPTRYPLKLAGYLLNYDRAPIQAPAQLDCPQLSKEQALACQFHINNFWTFIWGPPGTGKSTVLRSIISLNLGLNQSSLLCASSNDAIDSVAEGICRAVHNKSDARLSYEASQAHIVRTGGSARAPFYTSISEKKVKKHLEISKEDPTPYENDKCRSVLATFYRVFLCPTRLFDTVLIEEAGMVPPPIAYALACLAIKRVVCCGDPKQAQPIFTGSSRDFKKETIELWKTNVFSFARLRMDSSGPPDPRIVALTVQYRFTEEILRYVQLHGLYPNYNCPNPPRALNAAENNALNCAPIPGRSVVILDTSSMPPNRSARHLNETHFDVTTNLVENLLRQHDNLRIGITSPYAQQAGAYRRWAKDKEFESVNASTVHGFQGSEFPFLIYDTLEGPGGAEFYNRGRGMHFLTDETINPEAIFLHNVALTRAQAKVIYIINVDYVRKSLSPKCYLQSVIRCAATDGLIIDANSGKPVALRALSPDPSPVQSRAASISADDFYSALERDAGRSREYVAVCSHEIDPTYIRAFAKMLSRSIPAGVAVRFYGPWSAEAEEAIRVANATHGNRISLVSLSESPHGNCLVVVDGKVKYRSEQGGEEWSPLSGVIPEQILRQAAA